MQNTNSSLQFVYHAYHASQRLIQNYVPYIVSGDLASYKTVLLGAALTSASIWAARTFLFKQKKSEQSLPAIPPTHPTTPQSAQEIAPTKPSQSVAGESSIHTTENKACLNLAGIAGGEVSKSLSSTNRAYQDDDLQSISSYQSNAEVQFTND